MKMENLIKAAAAGTVAKVAVAEGDKVEKGTVMIGF
jgi:biotin carboxyl carrier protein